MSIFTDTEISVAISFNSKLTHLIFFSLYFIDIYDCFNFV